MGTAYLPPLTTFAITHRTIGTACICSYLAGWTGNIYVLFWLAILLKVMNFFPRLDDVHWQSNEPPRSFSCYFPALGFLLVSPLLLCNLAPPVSWGCAAVGAARRGEARNGAHTVVYAASRASIWDSHYMNTRWMIHALFFNTKA